MKKWNISKKIVSLLLTGTLMISMVSPAQRVSAETAAGNDVKTFTENLSYDFKNGEPTENPILVAGNNVSTTYQKENVNGVEQTVAVFKLGKSFEKSNMVYVPYTLKAGSTYEITMTYKREGWCCSTVTHSTGTDANGNLSFEATSYQTETKTVTIPEGNVNAYWGIGTNNQNVSVYVAAISVKDVTPKTFNERVSYDFSNGKLEENPILVAGNNVSTTYQKENVNGVEQTVAVFKLGKSFEKSNMVYVPYTLKAGSTYEITMTYKREGWCCSTVTHSTGTDANGNLSFEATSYQTETKTVTIPEGNVNAYWGIGTNNQNVSVYIAAISVKDVTPQKFDKTLSYNYADGMAIVDPVLAAGNNVSTTYQKDQVNGVEQTVAVFKLGSSFTKNNMVYVPYTLKAGSTYEITMTYKREGWCCSTVTHSTGTDANANLSFEATSYKTETKTVTIPEGKVNAYWGIGTNNQNVSVYVASVSISECCNVSVTSSVTGGTATVDAPHKYVGAKATFTANAEIGYLFKGWTNAEGTVVSTDSVYTATLQGDIVLTPVFESLDRKDYHEDFEKTDHNTLKSSEKVTVEYVDDTTYGKVAAIKFIKGTMADAFDNNEVKIPYKLLADKNYKVEFTYKFVADDGKSSAAFYPCVAGDANTLDTWLGSSSWKTVTRTITGRSDGNSVLRFSSVESGILYIASISITYGTGIAGDVNGDKYVNTEDVDMLRKYLAGSKDVMNDVCQSALDANGDNAVDVKDLVHVIKAIEKSEPTVAVIDECANYTVAQTAVGVRVDNNTALGDTSVFRLASSAQEHYVVYKVGEGITEGAVQYDFPETTFVKDGDFTFEVSSDGKNYKKIEPQDITSVPDIKNGWVRRTAYFSNVNHMLYFKIIFPKGYTESNSPGIRKVQFNVLNEQALASIGGTNSKLRQATTIYVDSVNGSDTNAGTQTSPLKTLQAVEKKNLVPGDTVRLKAGGTYTGNVTLVCNGTKNAPITICSYGDGNKPVITNFDGGTGICITGSYVMVQNLKFTCANGISGLDFYAVGNGETKGISVTECDFSEINYNQNLSGKSNYMNGGVHFIARGNQPTWFEDILVKDNTFDKVARTAIYVTTYWAARDSVEQKDTLQKYNFAITEDMGIPTEYLSKNVKICNNTVTNNGGDAIMLHGVDGGLVEYNTVKDTKLFYQYKDSNGKIWSPAFAAVWCYCSDNVIFQYNEVSGTSGANGGTDLQAFDIDFATNDCIVQYNYSHGNQGGFVLLCATDAKNNGQVNNAIVRFNISVNDGGRSNEIRNSVATPVTHGVFDLVKSVRNAHIYNNTIYCANENSQMYKLMKFSNYSDTAVSEKVTVTVENNIFYAAKSVPSGQSWWKYMGDDKTSALEKAVFNQNVMYNIDTPTMPGVTVTNVNNVTPEFVNGGSVPNGRDQAGSAYALKGNSVLFTSGKVIADNGKVDYFGHTLPSNCKLVGAVNQR